MANAFFVPPRGISAVAASGTALGDPLNVTNDYAGVIWRAAGASMLGAAPNFFHYLDLDLGLPVTIDTVMLFGLQGGAPADATILPQVIPGMGSPASENGVASPLYAGAFGLNGGGRVGLNMGAPLSASRYFRISISASTRFDLTLSRIVVGTRTALERNFSFGAAFGVRDLGSVDFSRRGVLLRQRGKKLRTVSLTFSSLRKDEVERVIASLIEIFGNTEPIALVIDPAADLFTERRCYFGPLVGDLGTAWRRAGAWEWKAAMVSLF